MVFKTLANEIAKFLTFENWLLPMPSLHIFSVHFGEHVLLWGNGGGIGQSHRAKKEPAALSLEATGSSEWACSPHSLKGATHVIKSTILLSIVLAEDRESSGEQQTESALSYQPLELPAGRKYGQAASSSIHSVVLSFQANCSKIPKCLNWAPRSEVGTFLMNNVFVKVFRVRKAMREEK